MRACASAASSRFRWGRHVIIAGPSEPLRLIRRPLPAEVGGPAAASVAFSWRPIVRGPSRASPRSASIWNRRRGPPDRLSHRTLRSLAALTAACELVLRVASRPMTPVRRGRLRIPTWPRSRLPGLDGEQEREIEPHVARATVPSRDARRRPPRAGGEQRWRWLSTTVTVRHMAPPGRGSLRPDQLSIARHARPIYGTLPIAAPGPDRASTGIGCVLDHCGEGNLEISPPARPPSCAKPLRLRVWALFDIFSSPGPSSYSLLHRDHSGTSLTAVSASFRGSRRGWGREPVPGAPTSEALADTPCSVARTSSRSTVCSVPVHPLPLPAVYAS